MKNIFPVSIIETNILPSSFNHGWESDFSSQRLNQHVSLYNAPHVWTYRIDILGIFKDIQSFYLSLRERVTQQAYPSEQVYKQHLLGT